jgi:hypothetical protein
MARHYSPSHKDYIEWCEQKVWVTGLTKEERYKWIPDFTTDVTRWMSKRGYKMHDTWNAKAVAKWLYAIQVQEFARKNVNGPISYPDCRHRDWPEDRDIYECEVTLSDLETFMYRWRNVEDFDMSTRSGQRVLSELHTLLYTYLDLETSKHGIKIARILQEAENDSDSDGDFNADIRDRKGNYGLW